MIVSVHLPKTAGTSFAATLERNFGAAYLRDYADVPINTPKYERHKSALQNCLSNAEKDFQGIECVHGHFLPLKYLHLADTRDITFVTWLRNPVERVLSHFHFWQQSFDPNNAPSLHRKMMEEKWSLERFCLGPEIRDLYFQFLYAFPLEYFSFIGITEFYDEDFALFVSQFLDSSFEPEKLNVRDTSASGYKISQALRSEVEQYHAKDMALYQRALEIRQTRRFA
jgi:Sulfotransferase family